MNVTYVPKPTSKPVTEAVEKLTDGWQTAKQLGVQHLVLNACVEHGLAESRMLRTSEIDPMRLPALPAGKSHPGKVNSIRKHYRLKK